MADHVVPVRVTGSSTTQAIEMVKAMLGDQAVSDMTEALDWRNWIRYSTINGQGLCTGCHAKKTAEGL